MFDYLYSNFQTHFLMTIVTQFKVFNILVDFTLLNTRVTILSFVEGYSLL